MILKNRNIYRFLVVGSFVALIALVLFGISQTLAYLNTGADRSAMLHLAADKEKMYQPQVLWKDTINPGRPIEPQTMLDIEKDYINAWYMRSLAYQHNQANELKDYYTTSALQNITSILEANTKKKITIQSTTTTHTIALDFYSADGQLAVITDSGVKEFQNTYKEDQLVLQSEHIATYKVLLLLEDGYWKIRHIIKEENKEQPTSMASNRYTKVVEDKIYVADKEYTIRGINYYPKDTPWDMFGDAFDIDIIAKDFDIIKNAGLNTIRIFVPYETFGKAQVDIKKMKKLKYVLDIAHEKKLMVMVTLFDFYGDYSVLDWTLTHRHAEQVVGAFKNHKAILAWDIKNEPNLDFESRGKENVIPWLKEMAAQIKQYDPNHLVTIGWSNMASATILEDRVDIVSFHYYEDIDDFSTSYKKLREATHAPLVLQEFGISSNRGIWSPLGISESNQADYHEQFQQIIQKHGANYMSWTLYDFENIPTSVTGKSPWKKHKQKHFGFINTDGKKKEAFIHIAK